jgi:hypothetical protein
VDHIHPGHHLEQLAGNVMRRPVAGRRHVDLAGISLGVGDELREGLGRDRWINLHDEREGGQSADRSNIADEIEIQFLIECCVDGVR